MLGGGDHVGTVANVPTDIDAKVASDGAWGGVQWVGGAEHGSSLFDGVFAFPDHGADWAGVHVFDQAWEEFLLFQVFVVLLEVGFAWHAEFHGCELVASFLESSDDLVDESSLDTIWLDSNECSFSVGHFEEVGEINF